MAVDLSVGSRNPSAMRRYVISFLCLGHFMVPAMPSLTGVQPQAVAPGKTTEITLHGDHFTDGLRLWTSFGEKVEFVERINAKQAVFRITAPRGAVAQVGALRVYDRTGIGHQSRQQSIGDVGSGVASRKRVGDEVGHRSKKPKEYPGT